jgi:fructose-1,6-bisphosphatase/inositol monophosphatase family enzyme
VKKETMKVRGESEEFEGFDQREAVVWIDPMDGTHCFLRR